jgi:hypothetical protein
MAKKLKIKKIVKVEAAVRSGCGKSNTQQCGMNVKNG